MQIAKISYSKRKDKVYVGIYDISNNNRRRKLAHFFEEWGIRIQKSAFLFSLTDKKYQSFLLQIPKYIETEDDVRIYRVYEDEQTHFGNESLCSTGFDVLII